MDFVSGLRCRECGRTYPAEALHVCDFCFGPLEVTYDYERVAATISRERIEAGPRSIWRYADLLPVADAAPGRPRRRVHARWSGPTAWPPSWGWASCGSRTTPPIPTGSFKDRVVSVALTKARQLGFKVAACASTGNLANSVAAHAARAGMDSVVLIPHDLERAKVTMTSVYGGRVFAVEGSYDDVNRLCAELTSEQPEWAFVNVNVRTYYAEGSKTLAFEVAEQLGWQAPDHVVVPDRVGQPADQGGQGVRGAVEGRAARRGAVGAGVGRPGRGVLAGGHRLRRGDRRHPPGQAPHHRQVAGHRQSGRRLVRARHHPIRPGARAPR